MQQEIPIPTVHLFPIIDQKLIELLQSLTPEDWERPTIAKKWRVKDIAAHLLDGNIRTLSLSRDKHLLVPDRSIESYNDLVAYLNELNASCISKINQCLVIVQLSAKSQSPGPRKNGSNRVGRCWLAFLVFTVVASYCAVSSLRLHRFSIRCDQNRSHQT